VIGFLIDIELLKSQDGWIVSPRFAHLVRLPFQDKPSEQLASLALFNNNIYQYFGKRLTWSEWGLAESLFKVLGDLDLFVLFVVLHWIWTRLYCISNEGLYGTWLYCSDHGRYILLAQPLFRERLSGMYSISSASDSIWAFNLFMVNSGKVGKVAELI